MKKERLDILLVTRGFFTSRERAKAEIMSGKVLVNMCKIDKAGSLVAPDSNIQIIGNTLPYVSRGGLKLKKAIDTFNINLQNKIVADIGASTGGFTDCSLQHGATKVYAIDVGYGQLAWSLRCDERVVNMERTNIKSLTAGSLTDLIDVATIDVAFISLEKILQNVQMLLKSQAQIIALIKPQFEAGKELVGKKGVVRDANVHEMVISKVIEYSLSIGLHVIGLSFSPVKGPEGNIEYLLHLQNYPSNVPFDYSVKEIVTQAHAQLS